MLLGERIKKFREARKMSQQELADKLKYLNQSQISKIEKGSRRVTAFDLMEISKVLGVSVDEFAADKKPTPHIKRRTG